MDFAAYANPVPAYESPKATNRGAVSWNWIQLPGRTEPVKVKVMRDGSYALLVPPAFQWHRLIAESRAKRQSVDKALENYANDPREQVLMGRVFLRLDMLAACVLAGGEPGSAPVEQPVTDGNNLLEMSAAEGLLALTNIRPNI